MSARVAGLGIGLFILAILWVLALLLCVALTKAQGGIKYAGFGMVVVVAVVTLVLAFIPRGPEETGQDVVIYDTHVVGRLVLISISALMALVGFFAFFGEHLASQRFGMPLKTIK